MNCNWSYSFGSDRCSHMLNSTQADEEVAIVTVSGSEFGRSEVESRLNVSKGKYHTLECVATTQGEQVYTLFSISGEIAHTRWVSVIFMLYKLYNIFPHPHPTPKPTQKHHLVSFSARFVLLQCP